MMEIPTNWTFKTADIAKNFDHHVREQLPWYDLATGCIAHIARHYIPNRGLVYDVGCSTGNIGRAIANTLSERDAQLVGIDDSEEMEKLYSAPGKFIAKDAMHFSYQPFDLAILFLSLMFIPVASRPALIKRLLTACNDGGAVIVFDKCIPVNGYPSLIMSRLALAGKIATGVDPKEILAKELSLIGVQRPINPDILSPSTEIFRFGDFAGWILEPDRRK